jgi:hypothetical protein
LGKRGRPPIQCLGCKEDHMYKHFPHIKDRVKTVHNVQEDTIVEDMGIIYATLDDQQEECQSNMIEVDGKIINHHVVILIDSREIHCYIDPKIVDRLHLEKSKLRKSSLFQLATGTKRRIHDMCYHWNFVRKWLQEPIIFKQPLVHPWPRKFISKGHKNI